MIRRALAMAAMAGSAAAPPCLAAGAVEAGAFESPALGVRKSYKVYLPESYRESSRRYPVVYLLHGWGAGEETWTSPSLDVGRAADELKLEAIIVMPDGDRSFYANSVTAADYEACVGDAKPARNRGESRRSYCVRTPRYEDYIVRDLVGHVDAAYRTVGRREGRALSGESAGGLGAMHLALRHKNLFSSVASHSAPLALLYEGPHPYERARVRLRTSFDSYPAGLREPVEILGTSIERWREHDPASLASRLKDGELAIYFDCGREDELGFHDMALYFHDRLRDLGISHEFESVPGGHDEKLWKERVKASLRFHARQFGRSARP